MSIWIYGKDKDGKKTVTSISIPYELILVILCLLLCLFMPRMSSKKAESINLKILYMIGVGFIIFASSKILQFRKGIWFSWGMKQMPITGKILYILGYILMVLGIIVVIGQI